jgi:cell division protein FtsZ
MSVKLSVPATKELKPRILVFGVGGAGSNAVNNMIAAELAGVEFVAANTDAQALSYSRAERRVQLGVGVTQGLGAGSRPDVGRAAAEEAIDQILEHLQGCHMAFITAGMGGGTGTGAAPVIARAARELNLLTVGVVTKPFQFEGTQRMRVAEAGIEELAAYVDTLIIIPNQNLFRIANERTTFAEAFKMADNVLYSGVRGVTDLMVMPGLINLDFADVKAVMSQMGKAMMGTGEGEGEGRALTAAERAIANPLLDDVSMQGARSVLINITGGPDLTLFEVDEAANRIRDEVDADATIIVGSALAEEFEGRVRVSVVATGIEAVAEREQRPSTNVTQLVRPQSARGHGGAKLAQTAAALASVPIAPPARAEYQRPQARVRLAEDPAQAELPVAMPAAPPAARIIEPQAVTQADRSALTRAPEDQPRSQPVMPPSPFEPVARLKPPIARGKPNFLQRIAGLGRIDPEVTGPAASVQEIAAQREETAPEPVAPAAVETATAPESRAPIGRLAPRIEDDLLDIPAFLRRQAD